MAGGKHELGTFEEAEEETSSESREVFLRDGRRVVVTDGAEQLVEIRSESGMVELRIRLTEQGPVLQMEAVRMQLRATEAVEIESPRVEIKGEAVELKADQDIKVDAQGDVRVVGKKIHLN